MMASCAVLFGSLLLRNCWGQEFGASLPVDSNAEGRGDELLGPHIVATTIRAAGRDVTDLTPYGLTRRDFQAIAATVPTVETVVPVREIRRQARVGEQVLDVQLVGTTADYSAMHGLSASRGRFLVEEDSEKLRNVAVIDDLVARRLFLGQDPIGETIRVDKHYFLVVGIVEKEPGPTPAGGVDNTGRAIYLPYSTMRSRFSDREIVRQRGSFTVEQFELSRIEITVSQFSQVGETTRIIESLLDRYHEDLDYKVTSSLDTLRSRP